MFLLLILDDYSFSSKVVGTGFSGPVRLATHKQTSKECAIKRYDKNAADFERVSISRCKGFRVKHTIWLLHSTDDFLLFYVGM